jgi:hypothetical protein
MSIVIPNGRRKNGMYELNRMTSWRLDSSPFRDGVALSSDEREKLVAVFGARALGDGVSGESR